MKKSKTQSKRMFIEDNFVDAKKKKRHILHYNTRKLRIFKEFEALVIEFDKLADRIEKCESFINSFDNCFN